MNVYVGRWDCNYCGHLGNLGPHTHCEQCGSARPPDVVFYLPRGIDTRVTDDDALAEAKAGANWVCAFCNNSNHSTYKACTSCGALKDDAKGTLTVREFDEAAVPRSSRPEKPLAQPEKPKSKGKFWKTIGIFALLAAAFWGLSLIDATFEATITDVGWERSIETETYKLVTEEDWDVPEGGQKLRSFEAVHHYDRRVVGYETKTRTVQEAVGTEQYVCGKRDLGNGYFEDQYCSRTIYRDRQETYEDPIYKDFPIYKTKYEYKIYRWIPSETYTSEGKDKRPRWAVVPATVTKQPDLYRIASKTEAYFFTVKDEKKGKVYDYEADFEYWNEKILRGKTLKAKRSLIFGYYKGLADQTHVRRR
jgi:hypothetical protein